MGRASELADICRKIRGSFYIGISVGGEISERQERIVRKSFEVPSAATLVALIDGTQAQTSECGIVITDVGAHWVNPWALKRVESRRASLTWDEIVSNTISRQGVMRQDITLGDGAVYSNASGMFSTKKLMALLLELQAAAKAFVDRRDRKPLPTVYVDFDSHGLADLWTVAINNKTGGPYGTLALQGFVAAGKVDPDSCLVWREGMEEWVLISSVPELMPAGGRPKRRASAPPLPASPPGISQTSSLPEASSPGGIRVVEVNLCRLESLLPLPGMTRERALAIGKHRKERGPVVSLDEFCQICGMTADEATKIQSALGFRTK